MNGACNPDTAEQQSHKTDQGQKTIKIFKCAIGVFLSGFGGFKIQSFFLEFWLDPSYDFFDIFTRSELIIIVISYSTSLLQKASLPDVPQGDINRWRHRCGKPIPARCPVKYPRYSKT